MSISLISTAIAATGDATSTQHAAAGAFSPLILLVGFLIILYFFGIRPNMKRAKEQREMLSSLNKGDEVVTTGGIIGRITKLSDDYVVLAIAENIEIKVQKPSVASILPKGTMKAI